MKTNEAAVALIKKSEGLRLEAYLCPAGVWTIGYGHTSASVLPGSKITEHQADVILQSDIERFERDVEKITDGLELNSNEFSALVSLSFNIGTDLRDDGKVTGFGHDSQLFKKLKAGDKRGAAAEFLNWTHAHGGVLPGLVKRRAAERALFLTPV